MDREELEEDTGNKNKININKPWSKFIGVSNGLSLFILGYFALIITFVLDYINDNSEKFINNLFKYLGSLDKSLIFMFLISILSISIGKYIMRKQGRELFLGKFLKHHSAKIDLFIAIVTFLMIALFITFELSIYFRWTLLLKPIVWLIEKKITLTLVSLLLSFYMVFALIESFETITMIILRIVNRFYEEIPLPQDRYALLISFIGIAISLITLIK